MKSIALIEKELKGLGFNVHGWGRTEVRELQNIILPEEKIFECVNGIYDGGFALLLATDVRVLLVDKKPLNYLTVEDMRFDMINEIDYNHRLFGAYIKISAGETSLKFTSLNQPRLRELIGHVQRCMAEAKKQQSTHQQGQNQHLEQINQQLQSYLVAQYKQQQKLHEQLQNAWDNQKAPSGLQQPPEPVRPSPELADYLFAQSLLEQHKTQTGQSQTADPTDEPVLTPAPVGPAEPPEPPVEPPAVFIRDELAELYSEGQKEVFGKSRHQPVVPLSPTQLKQLSAQALTSALASVQTHNPFSAEVNPLRVAYSKLPMALRNRKFGRRPSFHAHSQEAVSVPTEA